MRKILVINGPNLNMVGFREPLIYGKRDYEDLYKFIQTHAERLELRVRILQSNYEGEIITWIQEAYQEYDGIIINAGAYTHTSIAILDALKTVNIPTVEVHLTDIHAREEFRRFSYISLIAKKVIVGKGFAGYAEALEFLDENC